MKKIYRNLMTPIQTIRGDMKKISRSLITPFLPSYEVVFTMYNVVPGQAVDKKVSNFPFERGASEEALKFYDKVVYSTDAHRLVPAEVQLKRRNKVIHNKHFGPVHEIKQLLRAS